MIARAGKRLAAAAVAGVLAAHAAPAAAAAPERAAVTPTATEPVTVAAMGDSLTQGYGLAQGAGFVPRLQAWLDAHGGGVVVLNAGVSGDTTAGGRARVDWTLTPEVDALIVALGGNDVLRGIAPREARANLDAILGRADAAGVPVLLIGIGAPGNYGPDYKAAFEAIYPELAAAHGALLVRDFLAPLRAAVAAGTPRARLMQADGIHPSAEGVRLIVDAIGPEVLNLVARARRASPPGSARPSP